MAIGYTAVMSTPAIFPTDTALPVLDQDKDAIFAAAIKNGDDEVIPSGNATFYWSGIRGGQTVLPEQSLSLPVTTSEGSPHWAAVTVPAGTFPADDEGHQGDGGLIIRYRITFSGWGGVCTVPLDELGNLSPGSFGTIQPPYPEDRLPDVGAFVDDMADAIFSWRVDYNKNFTVSTPIAQQSARIEWRSGPSEETHTVLAGSETAVVIPAGTLPSASSTAEWRVAEIVMADGASYQIPRGWYPFSTIDELSQARAISPVGLYLSGDKPVEFVWEHIIATGTAPTASELQWSADSGASWNALATVTGSGCSVTIGAGELPSGDLQWQVRTCNSDGIPGEWSEPASIVVYGLPDPPVILSVGQSPRPTVRWQSVDQQAWELRAGTWQSGPVFGTEKEAQVPVWLPDGDCSIAVRIQSALGYWSNWAETTTTVVNQPPGTVALTAVPIENGVALSWEAQGSFDSFEVCRNGEIIAVCSGSGWTDWLSAGNCSYTVRGVSGNYYALSLPADAAPICRCGAISAIDGEEIDWILLSLRRGGPPSHVIHSSRQVTPCYRPGRALPVAEVSPWEERLHLLSYSLLPGEEAAAEQLRALVGRTVLYKDSVGARVIGVLASLSETRETGIDLTLTLSETDWRECNEST